MPPPTTTHHHPPPSKIYPPPSTTTHYQPKYIHHYLPFPKKWNTTPPKPKHIACFRHCFNSFFFFEMQYSFLWQRFCVIKFWSVRSSNSKFPLYSVHFAIFKSFESLYFTSLRLQDLYCLFFINKTVILT